MKGQQESLTTVVVKSWPTPAARDHKDAGDNVDMEKVAAKSKLSGVVAMHGHPVPASSSTDGSRPGLSEVATRDGNWTTPAATDTGRTTQYQQGGKALSMQVWQTATVSTGAHRQKDGSMIDKLDQQVKSWATPSAFDGQRPIETQQEWEARNARKKEQNPNLGQLHKPLTVQMTGGGKLNPRWVETLMGLPVGWTMPSCASPVTIERMSSDYSVTVLSQQQQNEPSGL